jgi:hypothetical protein
VVLVEVSVVEEGVALLLVEEVEPPGFVTLRMAMSCELRLNDTLVPLPVFPV